MFNTVGAIYQPKYVITPGWFKNYWWTGTEEEEFKQWLLLRLVDNKKLRRAMLNGTVTSKKIMVRAINDFLLNYGWVTLYKNRLGIRDKGEPEGYYISEIKRVLSKKDFKLFNKACAGNTIAVWCGEEIVYDYDFDRFKDTLIDRKR